MTTIIPGAMTVLSMRNDYLLGLGSKGFHRIHYTDWGDPDAGQVVICVHGLTRSGRDFDDLARALAPDFRVVCPDIAGRGRSDWLADKAHYAYPQYCADMNALIARVTAGGAPRRLYWVGTSMGGTIGMLLASHPQSPIQKLVINDVGALIPKAALARIASYVGRNPRFERIEDLEAHVRVAYAPFGPLTDLQWRRMSENSAVKREDGSWAFHYDPGIGAAFGQPPFSDVDLWPVWDTVTCPTLLLRGTESDLLLRDTAEQMTRRGPCPRLVEFAGVGHAPALMADDQIRAVRDFLLVN